MTAPTTRSKPASSSVPPAQHAQAQAHRQAYNRRKTRAKVKSDVRSARSQAVALYYQARSTAFMTGRFTTLTFTGNQAVITATPRLSGVGTADTIGNVQNLGQLYGVTVTVSPGNAVAVDPRGLGNSVPTTVYFTRSGQQDSMLVTGFGRVIR